MSYSNDCGGSAFPSEQGQTPEGWNQTFDPGMSMRDYFAAKAMQGLLARSFTKDEKGRPFVEWVVAFSYEIADAMLTKRVESGAL